MFLKFNANKKYLQMNCYKKAGYVQASTYKINVMKSLDGETKKPSQIAKDTDILQSYGQTPSNN